MEDMEEQESKTLHWSFTLLAIGASFGTLGISWVTFNTVINHLQLIGIVVLIALISYLPFKIYFTRRNAEMKHMVPLFCLFGFGPLSALLLFSLNTYVPVGDEFTEKYKIENIMTVTADGKNDSKCILTLENKAYSEYRSVRTFYDRNLGSNDKYITITFQRGLLGLKQLKHVKFSSN